MVLSALDFYFEFKRMKMSFYNKKNLYLSSSLLHLFINKIINTHEKPHYFF